MANGYWRQVGISSEALATELDVLGYVAGYGTSDAEKLAGVPSTLAAGVLAETELSRPLVLPVTPIAQRFVWIIGGGATPLAVAGEVKGLTVAGGLAGARSVCAWCAVRCGCV